MKNCALLFLLLVATGVVALVSFFFAAACALACEGQYRLLPIVIALMPPAAFLSIVGYVYSRSSDYNPKDYPDLCPNCAWQVPQGEYEYCANCGQLLESERGKGRMVAIGFVLAITLLAIMCGNGG